MARQRNWIALGLPAVSLLLLLGNQDSLPRDQLLAGGARFFSKRVRLLPLVIGLFFGLFSSRKQMLRDIMAGTLVIRQ